MSSLGTEQWRDLSPYLDQALDIPEDQRAAWLESIGRQDSSLVRELKALLVKHDALVQERFLEPDAVAEFEPSPASGQVVGAYQLDELIGRGGMGTVWLARRADGRFEGRVAVKFLNFALVGSAADARFRREGSILARLAHPNIARLIDAGVSATGQPYLVLEHIEGTQIDKYCNDRRLDVGGRIRLFLEVLAAVAHAHANLIVHRDLKPSNVLVTRDGQVKLLDFGIAKLLEDQTDGEAATALTREGGRALTPAYAAPEQLVGEAITTGTDVYALGVLLYILLSGKHPAESALHSPADLMRMVIETDPPRPSELCASNSKAGRAVRGDLDTIVAKALKKNVAERYPSVTSFADDLRRYLGNQPITARPDSLAYRAKKFLRRNRVPVALAGAAFIATVGGITGILLQARTARVERDFALRQLSRAEAINDLNSFVLSDAAPSGKAFKINELLSRAEELVRLRQGDEPSRVDLLLSIGGQYTVQEEYAKARRLLDQAYTLARGLPDRSIQARTACALAQALAREGDLQRAERLLEEGLQQVPLGARFSLDRVFCLQCGTQISLRAEKPGEAVTRAQAAQRALRSSPFQSPVLELDNLINLASAYRYNGQAQEANVTFEQASTRLTELGRGDTQRAVKIFNNWGLALWIWGQPLESERVLRRAIALGQDDRAEQAVPPMVLLNYARPLIDLGRLNEAADYVERAHAKGKAAGDQAVIEQSLLLAASTYRKQQDLERAEKALAEVDSILRRNLPPGHIAFTSLDLQWGLIAQARGHLQKALDLATRAVDAAEARLKQGYKGTDSLRLSLLSRSAIHGEMGHVDDAVRDAQRALQLLAETTQPGSYSVNLGRSYVALGRALKAQGNLEKAVAAFRSGLPHLESALGADHSETRAARELAQPRTSVR